MRRLILLTILIAMPAQACFLQGERISGMNKICYYRCIEGEVAITIGATQLCPLSI